MNKLLVGMVLSLLSLVVHSAIEARIEPTTVRIGETFTLRLTHGDPQNGSIPNLVPLQKDFVILGTERSMSYSVINGQSQSSGQWIIALRAKKTGTLTIPTISIGTDSTKPLTIFVADGGAVHEETPTDTQQPKDVILSATVDKSKPYVNQQIIYTVRLFNSKRLLDASYEPPQIENALLVPLGEGKQYQMVQNDINYIVEEQRYAVFPQKSGKLTLISPSFTALIYSLDPQRIRVQDNPIHLDVQPIPKEFKGQWLPAKSMTIDEHYEHANEQLNQGATITRVITLEGGGVPAQLLPNIRIEEGDGYNVYPEKEADKNQVKHGELYGLTELKVTYLFNKSGTITLPELRLPWFNTETGKEEIATLPAKRFKIAPVAGEGNKAASVNENKPIPKTLVAEEVKTSPWAWRLAIFFAIAWIVTLGTWAWQKRPSPHGFKHDKKALDELRKACKEGSPNEARDALIRWAQIRWPNEPILHLSQLAHRVRDVHFKKQIHQLSQVLYKNSNSPTWRGDELLKAVLSLKQRAAPKKKKINPLPPMNPF